MQFYTSVAGAAARSVVAGLSMVSRLIVRDDEFDACFSSKMISEKKCGDSTRSSYLFPLYLKNDFGERDNIKEAHPSSGSMYNLTKLTVDAFEINTKQNVQNSKEKSTERHPEELMAFIYAILHSPNYRHRYDELLRVDFPRIPIPKGHSVFHDLCPLGSQLLALHMVDVSVAKILYDPDIHFAGSGDARVEQGFPKYQDGKVMINAKRWFEDVPSETWAFHVGGYQVCEKWLKDRAAKGGKNPSPGRVLTDEDILHYRRIVTSLTETRRLMAEIDKTIETHGGWPGAFKGSSAAE